MNKNSEYLCICIAHIGTFLYENTKSIMIFEVSGKTQTQSGYNFSPLLNLKAVPSNSAYRLSQPGTLCRVDCLKVFSVISLMVISLKLLS